MSEVKHPSIDLDITAEFSLRELFAQEAYHTLSENGLREQGMAGTMYVEFAVTERLDILETNGEEAALRLRGLPVMLAEEPNPMDVKKGSDEYLVIELQYGKVKDKDIDMPTDDDFHWQSYVMAVIKPQVPDEVDVLDGSTGKDLDNEDLARVLFTLQFMRREFDAMRYEDEIEATEMSPDFHSVLEKYAVRGEGRTLIPFVSEKEYVVSGCDECQAVNTPCTHNAETLN